jgi:hypothetical protein
MLRRTSDEQAAITKAWSEVEDLVGSLRGRKFYGAFDSATNEYLVCVQWREGDVAQELGLEDGVLPGGKFVAERLTGSPPAVYELIKPTIERLTAENPWDTSRPLIEFYRRHDVIDILLPIS